MNFSYFLRRDDLLTDVTVLFALSDALVCLLGFVFLSATASLTSGSSVELSCGVLLIECTSCFTLERDEREAIAFGVPRFSTVLIFERVERFGAGLLVSSSTTAGSLFLAVRMEGEAVRATSVAAAVPLLLARVLRVLRTGCTGGCCLRPDRVVRITVVVGGSVAGSVVLLPLLVGASATNTHTERLSSMQELVYSLCMQV